MSSMAVKTSINVLEVSVRVPCILADFLLGKIPEDQEQDHISIEAENSARGQCTSWPMAPKSHPVGFFIFNS